MSSRPIDATRSMKWSVQLVSYDSSHMSKGVKLCSMKTLSDVSKISRSYSFFAFSKYPQDLTCWLLFTCHPVLTVCTVKQKWWQQLRVAVVGVAVAFHDQSRRTFFAPCRMFSLTSANYCLPACTQSRRFILAVLHYHSPGGATVRTLHSLA